MTTPTAGRWIVVSGVHPDAGAEMLICRLAQELAFRYHVLLWDVESGTIPLAKSLQDLAPYRQTFSPELLRNYLSQSAKPFKVMQGSMGGAREVQKEIASLLIGA